MRARLRVGFVLANHFTLTAFSVFVDTLRLAADEGDLSRPILCDWTVMSAGRKPVRASCGVDVAPNSDLVDPKRFDYVAVVGGLLHRGAQVDARTEAWLREAAAKGVKLIGVCTGSFILARAGLMKGRRACVSWYHHRDMLAQFADVTPVSDRLFLIDGDRITCPGGAGAADLAAALVDLHVGGSAAQKSLNVLLIDRPREAEASQPQPAFVPREAGERVRRAVALMEERLSNPLTLDEIAARIGLSARQLDRLFRAELGHPPATIYRRMRLSYGRWLLAQPGRRLAEIAAMAGFSDGAHFARAFRKHFGQSPSALRGGGPDLAADGGMAPKAPAGEA